MSQPSRTPLAIVGVSALFPGSVDKTGFWRNIVEGADLLTDVPPGHWLIEDYYDADPSAPDKTYAKRGGFLPDVDFDALSWGIPPSIVPATDTAQLLALIVAQQVLSDATRGDLSRFDRERTSVILGVTSAQELLGSMVSRLQRPVWTRALREAGLPESEVGSICDRIAANYAPWQESTFPGLLGNVVAGRIANRLGIGGTNCVTDAACASTFSALSMAASELYLGDSDLVVCGGVDTMNDIFMYMCFSKTPAMSPTGDCRPFSDAADGTMLGEGLGMFALRRLEDAERDGDPIYAVIRGVGTSSDGRSKSVYAPLPKGQAKSIRRALAHAGYGAETVELIEAHGTGTKAGDAAEFEGLRMVFDESGRADRQWCALGSVKSQVGHTKAAAGAAGLFKAVLALQHKTLPPSAKIARPNPKLNVEESPFYLSTEARPWVRSADHPRRAGVSSFGFGGSNFHVSVEEYTGPGRAKRARTWDAELVLVAGSDGAEVAAKARALADEAESAPKQAESLLQFLAARSRREAKGPARLALVVANAATLATRLRSAAQAIEAAPEAAFERPDGTAYGVGEPAGGVAFVFPGQGSQSIGMCGAAARNFDAAISAWDEAAALDLADAGLHEVVFPRPVFDDADREAQASRLTATEWAQPAIGCASESLLRLMQAVGITPDAVAGHSFGEVTALRAAGALSPADFLRVARLRGEQMAAASGGRAGAMTAVSATRTEVEALIEASGAAVVLANHNHPKQVVVSGPEDAVDAFEHRAKAAGVHFRRLTVATAFHSPLVADAVGPFEAGLADIEFAAPALPVWSNAEASAYGEAIRSPLAGALARPVRFVEMVEGMAEAGIHTFVEVGPGAALTGMISKILDGRPHAAIALDRRGKDGLTALFRGLARLYALGVELDASALDAEYDAPIDPRELPAPKLAIEINGSNYGKPYPPEEGASALPGPNPEKPAATPAPAPAATPARAPAATPAPTAPAPMASAISNAPVSNGQSPRTPLSHAPTPQAPSTEPTVTHRNDTPIPGPAWLSAWQEAQRHTAEAHAAFQQAMAQAHAAYLRTAESSFVGLAAVTAGMPAQPVPASVTPQPLLAPAVAHPMPAPVVAQPMPALVAQPMPAPVAAQPMPAPVAQPMPAPVAQPMPAPVAQTASAAPADLKALMFQVVADSTGYPAEMLGPEMDLEGDLGIDSIKRVEILSTLQERAPGLPDVDAQALAAQRTLGEIVAYLDTLLGSAASAPAGTGPAAVASPAPTGGNGLDLGALLIEVIAEKTGYPAEMLTPEMELEGDLGVDSIKRVEILSAMQERAPGLPEVDATAMGALSTLGAMIDHLATYGGAPAAAPAPTTAPASPRGNGLDLGALLIEVIAEKTGYPAEMLTPEMELEGDLGVDSIKRVEILSAMQERAPGLPEVDATAMGALSTLGAMIDHLQTYTQGGNGAGEGTPDPFVRAPRPEVGARNTTIARPGRWVTEAVARPAAGLAPAALFACERVVVTDEVPELAAALAGQLKTAGVPAVVGDPAALDADGVILLAGLAPEADASVHASAFEVARAVAPKMIDRGGFFAVVQDTGGRFEPTDDRAWTSGLVALARTAAQEWPKAVVRALDVAGEADRAARIARELLNGAATREVGLPADGPRVELVSHAEAPTPGDAPVDQDAVVVVSGGARGVTARCVIEWARQWGGRFALLGRTPLADEPAEATGAATEAELKRALLLAAKARGEMPKPADIGRAVSRILAAREVRGTLAAINAAGGEARYIPTDVTDGVALGASLGAVRDAWGPLRGVVHGAGVLADKWIQDKTDAQFARVFRTKVDGLRALLAATADDPLQVLCAFSSVAARCGNRGQVDYAMANQVLEGVLAAEAARRPDCVVKALGWGPWEGGMVTPQLKARFEALGVELVTLDGGAHAMLDELADRGPRRAVVLGGEPKPAALLDEDTTPGLALAVRAGTAVQPYLAGHTIAGVPVVPMALAAEWCARAATALRPDLKVAAVRDLRVLRGLKLAADAPVTLPLHAEQVSNGRGARVAVTIRDVAGHPAYRAEVELADEPPALAPLPEPDGLGDWGEAPFYDGFVLFHEGAFQVVDGMDGWSADALAARLRGVRAAGWPDEGWRLDVAALDAALQVSLAQIARATGAATLPMGLGTLMVAGAPADGPLRVVGHLAGVDATRHRASLSIADAEGRVVLRLDDVDLVRRPDQPAARPRA